MANNKLREALEELIKFTCNSCERRLCEDDAEEENGQLVSSPCSAIIKARNTLAEPVKNCEVGSVEEQYSRMFRECYEWKCMDCKQSKDLRKCALSWAQKPYKEGGSK